VVVGPTRAPASYDLQMVFKDAGKLSANIAPTYCIRMVTRPRSPPVFAGPDRSAGPVQRPQYHGR